MGYCFDRRGRLVCDSCGVSGYVRKRPCPYGYCQSAALCGSCKTKHRFMDKEYHAECKVGHERYLAREAAKQARLDAGDYLRVCAHGKETHVDVVFRNKEGKEVTYAMSSDAYHSISYLENASPEDYRSKGYTVTESLPETSTKRIY
jgi:hypothetical protein